MSADAHFLEKIPLFTLTVSKTENVKLDQVFEKWPAEKMDIINQAQNARDLLADHLKIRQAYSTRISDIDKYLPLFVTIEKEKLSNPKITASQKHKFQWNQTPIVTQKYYERSFSGNYCQNETLHIIWLKGIIYLNMAFEEYEAQRPEQSVLYLRTAAGIFEYLASDRCRSIDKASAPVEFQPAVLNSLMNLMLGQAYAIIAGKGEFGGTPNKALGKVLYASHTAMQTALDSIKGCTPNDVIDIQYVHWLEQLSAITQAYTCIFFAKDQKANDEDGMAIGLIDLALKHLKNVEKCEPKNIRPNAAIRELIDKLTPIRAKWADDNFLFNNKPIANEVNANRFIATQTLSVLNVPQPVQYSPPEPGEIAAGTPATPEGQEVVKKITPSGN